MTSTVAVVQARMGSTRLPGKVLSDICGEPLIARQMARMEQAKTLDSIVVAIPEGEQDDILASVCLSRGWAIFRGSEHDVLSRYLGAAEASEADVVVRMTMDEPLIDPAVIDATVEFYRSHATEYDFVANNLVATWPHGMDCEVMPQATLAIAAAKAHTHYDREHVTPWITRASDGGRFFRLGNLPCPVDGQVQYRLTTDYPDDLALVRAVYRWMVTRDRQVIPMTWRDITHFLEYHPEFVKLNAKHARPHAIMGRA